MRKLSLALLAVVAVAITVTSCKKVLDAFFDPIESPLSVEITIPVVTNTTSESVLGASSVHFNLDSIIRKNTKDVFNINSIKSVKLKDMAVNLLNADDKNNLANFETFKVTFTSSANATPVVLGTATNPDTYATSTVFPISNSVELKNYLSGSDVTFTLYSKARRATTHTLTARVSVTLKSE